MSKILDFSFKTFNHTLPLIISHPFQHLSCRHSYSLSCLTHFLLSFLLLLLSHTFPPTIRIRYPIPHLFSHHSSSHFLYNFTWILSYLFIHSSSNNSFLITRHSLFFFSVLVTAFNKEQGGTKLLVSLHRGMSFGVRAS